jgi:hypothetical protein
MEAGFDGRGQVPEQVFTPTNPKQIPRPNRSYSGNIYHATGISDHLPVGCVLEF